MNDERCDRDPQIFHRHITLWPNRLWLNISAGHGYVTVGLQHLIADPPSIPQTCHHWVMLSRVHGLCWAVAVDA